MQLIASPYRSEREKDFQYPRSDRRRCNLTGGPGIGKRARTTFSILGRIGGDATHGGNAAGGRGPGPFSILGRIGGDATCWEKRSPEQRLTDFQYPRSDRRRCNWLAGRFGGGKTAPFSILGRIGGDATFRVVEGAEYARLPFSILGRIGGDATCMRYQVFGEIARLSVSSVGSEAMQRGDGPHRRDGPHRGLRPHHGHGHHVWRRLGHHEFRDPHTQGGQHVRGTLHVPGQSGEPASHSQPVYSPDDADTYIGGWY